MFNVKKDLKQGTCSAMRCKVPALPPSALTPAPPMELCEKHHTLWAGEGCPPLTSVAAAPTGEAGAALAVSVPTSLQGSLDKERAEAQQVLQLVQGLPVETPEQREFIGSLINQAGAKVKELEDQRTSVTGPLLQIKRTIDGWFKPPVEFYEAIKKTLAGKLQAWESDQKTARTAALVAIAAGAGLAPAAAFEAAHANVELPDNVGSRTVLEYEITDWAMLPGKYKILVANHEAIKADIAKHGLTLDAPGLRVFETTKVTGGRS